MTKSEILTTLINRFFSFDAEKGNHEDYSMDEFIGYLNSKSGSKELKIRKISGKKNKWLKDEQRSTSIDISILIVMMYHYAKGYIKKALDYSRGMYYFTRSGDERRFLRRGHEPGEK